MWLFSACWTSPCRSSHTLRLKPSHLLHSQQHFKVIMACNIPSQSTSIFFTCSDEIYGPKSKLTCVLLWVCVRCVQSVMLQNRNNTVFKMEMVMHFQVVLDCYFLGESGGIMMPLMYVYFHSNACCSANLLYQNK